LLRRGGGFEEINARGFRCVLDVLSVEPGSLIPVDANLVLPFNNPPLRVRHVLLKCQPTFRLSLQSNNLVQSVGKQILVQVP
jgi:hypothetical protein